MADLNEIQPYVEFTRPYFEYIAISTGAISGALHARQRSFDLIGVLIIGLVSGLGGGIIRDVLLSEGPALALRRSSFFLTALLSALVGSAFGSKLSRFGKPMWLIDTLALGLFAVVGLQRAEIVGLEPVPSVFLGVVTCVGGGLVRDVLCRETPKLLLPGEPYTVIAVFSGVIYTVAVHVFGLSRFPAELLAIAGAFWLRLIVVWKVPVPPDTSR